MKSRSTVDIVPAMLHLVNLYPIRFIYCDNEASFNSQFMEELCNRFNITITPCPPSHSSSNGQVERFHSTLAELARCLKNQRNINDTVELILLATIEYNRTIHSVTKEKPVEVLHHNTRIKREEVKANLVKAQEAERRFANRKRINRQFKVGDRVFVKANKRIGTKLSIRFVKRRIQADLGSTVLIGGRIVHKDNLR